MLVKLNTTGSSANEWCILEFQGDMVGELTGNTLGEIEILDDGTKAEMTIGQHFLEGTVITLKLPFLVVEKEDGSHGLGTSSTAAPSTSTDRPTAAEGVSMGLDIQGYVTKKIIFKQRPKPIGLKPKRS